MSHLHAPCRFMLAWELGGGLGHIVPLAQVAEHLVAAGHEVHFVLRDLSGAPAGLGALAQSPQVRLWQAPLWQPQLQGLPPPVAYAELLFRAGYLDPIRLGGLVAAWQQIIRAIQPHLLLADHAPTALLAARATVGAGFAKAVLGTGFFVPPNQQPQPAFSEWERVDAQRLKQSEARALQTCNAVLSAAGQPPLAALHGLTDADEHFLLTWPELDHYGAARVQSPGRQTYWGPLAARDSGVPAHWPEGEGPALFAYLKADYPALDAVLQALGQAPCRSLVVVPGLSSAQRQRHAGPRLHLADCAVAMSSAMPQADAVLCNAGSGTVFTALQAGLPVLMLPMHAEQLLFARRVVAQGAGGLVMAQDVPRAMAPALRQLLEAPAWREQARAIALRHAPKPGEDVALQVAQRCLALAAGAT